MKTKIKKRKLRTKVLGDAIRPRLSVFRSNRYIFAQLIDDANMKTLIGISENKLKSDAKTKSEKARELGKQLAVMAVKKKIEKIVFDKGQYSYHGRVKELAEGLREGGIKF
ncbi:MAG: 50S ribosomal protein L18 [Microgenomates group bacterium GW2011_GWC1_38_14]|nr:MAG: 50S ribosomal protein L18 [Candidatus Levybacteria bacterium GW2011_GWA2_36_13]KKQ00804.1 MAG: 50S ribosomal protein L18 [Candidatus Levybacteria bacterium GW2011_GWB1_36_18]KKQ58309.1 MAG: 50S ribosomal protein L18 [Microgenomates group bacterium GW2011_GWC1_38_14]KKR15902.1 MAG: 50S ribosomal protein L18 [Candidatus Levybacteria bacterium GW2011_GWA1_39_32]OGH43845.1 MAG: 50S ribosomal protein L18 [Candidatus Levybacteria bacterium RIFCSPLOWO2_02_FULL_37_11]